MVQESQNKILVIDDELTVRQNVAAYLEDSGFTVYQAENGRVGLDIYFQEKPDAVLVDLDMPEVNGFEVLVAIREDSIETPVIIVSGAGEVKNAIEASRLGAWDFVLKPIFNMAVVEHIIQKSMERKGLLVENRQYRENLENLVKDRTLELENRNTELVELNKRLRIEISDRKLAEAQLNQAKERSIALRRFSNRIAEFTNEAQLLMIAMDELCANIYMSGAVLYYDFQGSAFTKYHFGNPPLDFLKKPPDFQLLKQLFVNRSQEVSEFRYIYKDSPIEAFFSDQPGAEVEGGHFVYFRGQGPHHHLYCFYREKLFSPFDNLDVEYVKSMVNEINNAYYSIQIIRENVWMERELRATALFGTGNQNEDTLLMPGFEMKAAVFPDFEVKRYGHESIEIDEQQTAVVISDIPGRRMSGAMYTRMSCEILEANSELLLEPDKVLAILNENLQTEFQPNRYLSISFFWLSKDTGEVRYFILGYEPMVLVKIMKDRYQVMKTPRFPFTKIGSKSLKDRFRMEQVTLMPGELLFGFSSNLLRSLESKTSESSPEQLYESIVKSSTHPLADIKRRLLTTLNQWNEISPVEGDVTILLFQKEE
jgi:DNA-binding response OmpR family regulator